MKIISLFCSILLVASCAGAINKTFVASTPADHIVRKFLGISLADSIDFIRWKLLLKDQDYELQCNYGLSKPNTNGFTNDEKKITIKGSYQQDKNYYRLRNGERLLSCFILNKDLLHLADEKGHLLAGNGGWSYSLNNTQASHSTDANTINGPAFFKDSVIFFGRTPCGVPGVVEPGQACYKLKWKITLYAAQSDADAGRFVMLGTRWRKTGGITGTWKIVTGKNGRSIYELHYMAANKTFRLLRLDERLVIFIDATGSLLVGNEDFSYALTRSN